MTGRPEHSENEIHLLEEILEQKDRQIGLQKNISYVPTFFTLLIVIGVILLVLMQTGG